mgnify:CR=1 FL=1
MVGGTHEVEEPRIAVTFRAMTVFLFLLFFLFIDFSLDGRKDGNHAQAQERPSEEGEI